VCLGGGFWRKVLDDLVCVLTYIWDC